MKTDLINYGQGIYELKILNTNESFMIELCDTYYESSALVDNYDSTDYNVTLLVNDEASDFIGVFESRDKAIEHIKTLY